MRLVELADDKYRIGGHEAGLMLAASTVALAGAVALAWGHSSHDGLLIGLVIASLTVVVALAFVRMRGDREVGRHVGDLVERHRRVEERNRVDSLTGTLTRSYFLETLKKRLRGEEGRNGLALLFIDIDRFKWVNDTFGHDMGDAMLAHVGRVLTTQFPGALVGRLGGDEFAMVFSGPVSSGTCSWVGERILEAFREPVRLLHRSIRTEATIGIAWAPEHATTSDELMSCADLALYEAKRAGRRCVRVFDAGLMKQRQHDAFIARELRAAILLDHLELHYQPIVRLSDGEIVSLEGLVRWRHPVRGLIPPSEFIPVAEDSALIEMLGDWVLRRACHDARNWASVRVGVNVSPRQLKQPDFVGHVLGLFAEEDVEPSRFVFEITENVLLECTELHKDHLKRLRELGIRLSLDDFGAGHSSLGYLRDFTFDSLKIDRDFVKDLEHSKKSQTFITAIAHVGRGLGLTVVAEGVENAEQARMIHAAGCDYAQGYFYARPMPAAQVTALLAAGSAEAERIRRSAAAC